MRCAFDELVKLPLKKVFASFVFPYDTLGIRKASLPAEFLKLLVIDRGTVKVVGFRELSSEKRLASPSLRAR